MIEHSSFFFHFLRFSTIAPLLILDFFVSFVFGDFMFLLNGTVLSKSGPLSNNSRLSSYTKGVVAEKLFLKNSTGTFVKRVYVSDSKKFILVSKVLSHNLADLKLSEFDLQEAKNSKLFANSEIFNQHGREILHALLLDRYNDSSSIVAPSNFFFFNEIFCVVHPDLTNSSDKANDFIRNLYVKNFQNNTNILIKDKEN